jgi:hypothetical protein
MIAEKQNSAGLLHEATRKEPLVRVISVGLIILVNFRVETFVKIRVVFLCALTANYLTLSFVLVLFVWFSDRQEFFAIDFLIAEFTSDWKPILVCF